VPTIWLAKSEDPIYPSVVCIDRRRVEISE
jgi:hypothetical protein